ncbi:MAG: hypothetical protein ABSB35_05625 [Bryobacteraceae bacterium]
MKPKPLQLDPLRITAHWLGEPDLYFAGDRPYPDPKVGIPLYGPRSLGTSRHKQEVHVGFIGTGEAIDHAHKFLEDCSNGVDGDNDRAPFPGCRPDRGFRLALRMDDHLVEKITRQESQEILSIKYGRERLERMLGLLQGKMEVLTQRDHPLDYVMLVLSQDLYKKCRVANYTEQGVKLHRDLRRAFKAMAMRYHKATQILQETTTGLVQSSRDLDHTSVIAWNLFTGMYFKADGLPWGPVGLSPATCFIGISFFRPFGETAALRASVVQAFDENGDGLILRGHNFHWDEDRQGKSPHLSEELSGKLIEMVLERYKAERKQAPRRVIIHKASRFDDAEREGFEAALKSVDQYDLLAVHPVSGTRLIRAGTRPPLRSTSFAVGDVAYLYTTGYIPELGLYPHGHVPSPLLIGDHIGDTPVEQLQREILTLTKMNWNSANMHGLMPITLRFSRLVGDVLREIPEDQEPEPKYKFYM